MSMRKSFLAAAFALGVVAVCVWFFFDQPKPAAKVLDGASRREAVVGEVVGSVPKDVASPSRANAPQLASKASGSDESTKLFRDMHAAKNLRRFVEEAKKTSLGNAYAAQVLMECYNLREAKKDRDARHDKGGRTARQEEAAASLLAKCDGFTEDEFRAPEMRVLYEVASRDRTYGALTTIRTRKVGQPVPEAELGLVFSSGDPMMIQKAVNLLWRHGENPDTPGFYFEGKQVEWLTPNLFYRLTSLVECSIAESCLLPSLRTEDACAGYEYCPDSVSAMNYHGLSSKDVERLQSLTGQVVSAVRNGQPHRFLQ